MSGLFVVHLGLSNWPRFTARLKANQPSPVLNACGLAVWASRMVPKLSAKSSRSSTQSYLSRIFPGFPRRNSCPSLRLL